MIPFKPHFSSKPREETVKQVMEILTPGQKEVLKSTLGLKRGQTARITGYAGTGKTFVISWLIRILAETTRKIAVCAPTHTAKDVLIEKVNLGDEAYNLTFTTIQSLLDLKEKINIETGEISFEQKRDLKFNEVSIQQYNTVIVDEASMLCPKLCDLIHKSWLSAKFILIVIGDPVQVPPVGYEESFAFTSDYDDLFNPIDLRLDQIIRQKNGSNIIDLSFEIRKNLLMGKEEMLTLCRRYAEMGGDIKPLESLNKQIFPIYKSDEYRKDPKLIKTVAFRKKRCQGYSDAIRDFVLERHEDDPIVGDIMVFNEPYVKDKDIIFHNKEEVLILEIAKEEYTFNFQTFTVNCYTVQRLKRNDFDDDDEKMEEKVLHITSKDRQRFNEEVTKFYNTIMSKPENVKKTLWPKFWSGKRLIANWTYIYTMTAHKSQGGTFDNVVVDVYDILNNPSPYVRNRILYTAITRASKNVYLRVYR